MATEGFKRKLAAILSTDAVGYSRLMGEAAEVTRINPIFSLTKYAKEIPWKEGPKRDRILDALRRAGLK